MTNLKKIIADNIKKFRHAKGWTQAEFAEKANLSVRGIQDIEYEKNEPRASTLQTIADALEVSVEDILGSSKKSNSKLEVIGEIILRLSTLSEAELNNMNEKKGVSQYEEAFVKDYSEQAKNQAIGNISLFLSFFTKEDMVPFVDVLEMRSFVGKHQALNTMPNDSLSREVLVGRALDICSRLNTTKLNEIVIKIQKFIVDEKREMINPGPIVAANPIKASC